MMLIAGNRLSRLEKNHRSVTQQHDFQVPASPNHLTKIMAGDPPSWPADLNHTTQRWLQGVAEEHGARGIRSGEISEFDVRTLTWRETEASGPLSLEYPARGVRGIGIRYAGLPGWRCPFELIAFALVGVSRDHQLGRYPMRSLIAASAMLLVPFVAASAQTNSSTGTSGSPTNAQTNSHSSPTAPDSSASNEPLRQQVQDNLKKAGFTDIKVMPTSFLVRAKDQSGNPVMMVINPDSFTEVTALPSTGNSTGTSAGSNASKH
jgi:hypothetical protein